MIKLVGISGKREAGKTTLADILVRDYKFQKASLAGPLKVMCLGLYDLTTEQLYGKEKESPTRYRRTDGSPWTARDILIREGCLKRSIDPDFWCEKLAIEVDQNHALLKCDYFVVDDIRFINEIKYLKREFPGAKFVRLERDQTAIGKAALDDLSETELDTFKDWDGLLLPDFNRNPKDLETYAEYVVAHL